MLNREYGNRILTHNVEIMYEAALSSTAEIRHINFLIMLILKINLESLLEEIIDVMIYVPRDVHRVLLHGPGETLGEEVRVGQQSLMNRITAIGRFI